MEPKILHRTANRMLDYLYIEPYSACNLKCKMCYSNVIAGLELDPELILDFVERYAEKVDRQFVLYWCGTGEIFLYKHFVALLNIINTRFGPRISHEIMTNGTIAEQLAGIEMRDNCNIIVSIDGLEEQHDWNRGKGNFRKTIAFCQEAISLGFDDIQARCLVTTENFDSLLEIQQKLAANKIAVSFNLPYTTRLADKLPSKQTLLRANFDDSKIVDGMTMYERVVTKYSNLIDLERRRSGIWTHLALTNYGVFSCCEGIHRLGSIPDPMDLLFANLEEKTKQCKECVLYCYC